MLSIVCCYVVHGYVGMRRVEVRADAQLEELYVRNTNKESSEEDSSSEDE